MAVRFKAALKKIAVPAFAEIGYHTFFEDARCFEFRNADDTIRITIDNDRYAPHHIRLRYDARVGDFFQILFNNESLSSEFGVNDTYYYDTQGELEEKLEYLIGKTRTLVLPYLDCLVEQYVIGDTKMYEILAENTVEKAENFAKKHDLPMLINDETTRALEEYLLKLRGSDTSKRKSSFIDNINSIVEAAAFLGEAIRINNQKDSKWIWIEKNTCYAIQYYTDGGENGTCQPLWNVLNFWNYYPEATGKRGLTTR
jgi:hypothetical protein